MKTKTCYAVGRATVTGEPLKPKEHHVINVRWCTRRTDVGLWTLTHRPTGLDATELLRSRSAAAALARALDRKYGVKTWMSTDPRLVPRAAQVDVQQAIQQQEDR